MRPVHVYRSLDDTQWITRSKGKVSGSADTVVLADASFVQQPLGGTYIKGYPADMTDTIGYYDWAEVISSPVASLYKESGETVKFAEFVILYSDGKVFANVSPPALR